MHKAWIPLGLFLVLAIFLWRGLGISSDMLPSALLNKPIPHFQLKTLEKPGQIEKIHSKRKKMLNATAIPPQTEAIFKGKVSVLHVWASWCGICYSEHSFWRNLQDETSFQIIGLNYKDDWERALQWLSGLGNPHRLNLYDPEGRLGMDLGVYGTPETFLIDQNGIIRARHVGAMNATLWKQRWEPQILALQQGNKP